MSDPTTNAPDDPEEPTAQAARPPTDARARGRKVATTLYYGFVAVICLVSTVQITAQALRTSDVRAPWATCREGLGALVAATDRARSAAPGTDGEEAALGRFRAALQPEWGFRDGVAATCRATEADAAALDAIERLRYAEEHAVRREAGELAPLRRKVQAIVDHDLGRHSAPGSTPH